MLYDEEKAIEDIKDLPRDVKLHLSHVIRNGLMGVIAICRLFPGHPCCEDVKQLKKVVERNIFDLENEIKELDL